LFTLSGLFVWLPSSFHVPGELFTARAVIWNLRSGVRENISHVSPERIRAVNNQQLFRNCFICTATGPPRKIGGMTIQPQQKMKTKNMTTLRTRNSISRSPLRRGFPIIALVLACFALSATPKAFGDTGIQNTATGSGVLSSNTSGSSNTADGFQALTTNTTGGTNTADGVEALSANTTGSGNTAIGAKAGQNLTTGSNNIDIGNTGFAAESNTIRIGDSSVQTATYVAGIDGKTVNSLTGTAVYIDSNGKLGTIVSSARFKRDIHSMDKASETILALRPVTFHYKPELDPNGIVQFGLVAEEVEKVNPALVVRDADGKPYTVRYEAVNAMLLNEFLKEHRKVQELEATVAQQHKGMEVLAAQLKEQASQIQKVSAQLELRKPGPQTLANN
jgi:hypothetical protein